MSTEPKIGDRIEVLKQELKIPANADLEKGRNFPTERLLSNGLIDDWWIRPIDWTSGKLDKFLTHYNVNREWWKTGKGPIFNTSVQNPPAVTEIQAGEIYRKIVEGGTEYLLVPRTAFEGKYRFIPIEEIELRAKELERKDDQIRRRDNQIEGLHELFKMIASGLTLDATKIQEAKKNAGV